MSKAVLVGCLIFFSIQFGFCQQYKAASLSVAINGKGQIMSLKNDKTEYAASQPGTLLRLVVQGKSIEPDKAVFGNGTIKLFYPGGLSADIRVQAKVSYLVLTLTNISKRVDAVKWGPFNTVIADTVGNTVGVVRSANYAIGLQTLNKKTTGGELVNDEGATFERGTTALARPFGASLQAFSINRAVDRKIQVWNRWPNVPVKAIANGELEGSSIALFGCAPTAVLAVIESITVNEKLPYAQWKGEWAKTSKESGRPYMITTFTEDNIDIFLSYAKRMGMAGVYHEDPFDTWGHFELKKAYFPNGRKGFKACVEKARAMGLRLGFHTLTNFITTNDPYVTPKPDSRLAQAGSAALVGDIAAEATEIEIQSDRYFRMKSDLNSVRIGDELIRYMDVTATPPYRLTGCVRGAYGTQKSAHKNGAAVARLIDHPYKVFFPDWEMQKEIAANIAKFINETGANQMDFDGHEGTYASGMGDLAFNTFAEDVLRLSDHPVVFGSSRDNHYFWRFNHYLNWGEPWYGSFRESQQDVRMGYQPFHETNYMPNMLGWFLITAQTNPDDIDWMLARAAGFNAGYALVLRKEALENPQMEEIIHRINSWSLAQQQHRFTREQQQWLRNPNNDARLVDRNGKLYLQQFTKYMFDYEARVLQPGQPTAQSWTFGNQQSKQIPQVVITATGEEGKVNNPVIEMDNFFRLEIPVTLEAGQTIVMMGAAKEASIYDRKGRLIRKIPVNKSLPELNTGSHSISFDGTTDANTQIKLKIEIKLLSNEWPLPTSS